MWTLYIHGYQIVLLIINFGSGGVGGGGAISFVRPTTEFTLVIRAHCNISTDPETSNSTSPFYKRIRYVNYSDGVINTDHAG